MEGVVLETYGSGNAPDNRPDLLEELKKATDAGVIIINCTQCLRGTVSASYATGKVPHITEYWIVTLLHMFSLAWEGRVNYCCFTGVDGCRPDSRW